MKKITASLVLAMLCTGIAHAQWSSFVIRENATQGAPLILANDDYVAGATELVTFASSQKGRFSPLCCGNHRTSHGLLAGRAKAHTDTVTPFLAVRNFRWARIAPAAPAGGAL